MSHLPAEHRHIIHMSVPHTPSHACMQLEFTSNSTNRNNHFCMPQSQDTKKLKQCVQVRPILSTFITERMQSKMIAVQFVLPCQTPAYLPRLRPCCAPHREGSTP